MGEGGLKMKKHLHLKKDVFAKKMTLISSKLLVLFLILSLSASVAYAASSKPGLAPVNPDFGNKTKQVLSKTSSSGGHGLGLAASPMDPSRLSAISGKGVLSAPVSYDLRNLSKVTSVKNQGSAGSCWVFASYGSLESYFMPGENRDFSENNMKNLLSSSYSEGFDRSASGGGNHLMSTAYLARWSGPVAESADAYSDVSTSSPTGLPLQKHVQDVLFIPNRQGSLDNDGIKQAIQNYGALYTTMYYDNKYYSSAKNSYYFTGTSSSNHAVDIVGWNDSYNKSNFLSTPPGNGAFIVRNSWGSTWGENGYFYISYYDSNIGKSNSVFTAESSSNYKYVYQYDPLGWVSSTGYSSTTCWCANVFTAKSNENLKAVSFYTTDSNSNYNIYIYTNLSSSPITQTGPVLTQSGISPTAGYHTILLNSDVALKAGQKFSVVLKLITPNSNYPVALEYPYSGYSSKAKANASESFISSDGVSWTDLTTYYKNTNVCIKAFTTQQTGVPVAGFSASAVSGNAPVTVTFTDQSTGAPVSWNWNFGDGATSTEQNPSHIYSAGTYTVNLTVSNANGVSSKLTTISSKGVSPVANFNSNVTGGYAPLAVQFTDLSKNATGWKWNFGDGTNSTQQSPVHTYLAAGTYTVNLTVSNAYGTNSKLVTMSVKAVIPVANFVSSVTGGFAPLSVQFTDQSKNATKWSWNFGDGYTSTEQNPKHTYSLAGNYNVNLTVSNGNGTNSKLATISVPTIYGYSFKDLNKNKVMDSGEAGISNIAINLNGYDTSKGSLVTTDHENQCNRIL